MSRLTRIVNEISSGKNTFIYIAIPLCIVAAIGSFLVSHFAEGVLMMVMGLVLGNMLEDRWIRLDAESRSNQHTTWDDLRQEFRATLKRARTVSFLAVSPLDILRSYQAELSRIVDSENGRVRFLVVDPNQEAMNLIAMGRPENKNDGQIFLKEVTELESNSQANGRTSGVVNPPSSAPLQVRVLWGHYNYVPSCILSLVDDDENDGVIFVTVYSYKQTDPSRPSLKLTRADGVWYTFFQREFKDLWGSSKDKDQTPPVTSRSN